MVNEPSGLSVGRTVLSSEEWTCDSQFVEELRRHSPSEPSSISSLWTTGVEQPTTAGAAQVQRYPFDPRYSHVACSDEKPQAALPKSTNPPSVVPLLAAAGSHFLSSITCTWGYLVVLKPGSEALAAQIRARFGPAVRVFIGPDPAKPTWNCWPFLKSTQPPRGLVVLAAPRFYEGRAGKATSEAISQSPTEVRHRF